MDARFRLLAAVAVLAAVCVLDGCATHSNETRPSISLARGACYGRCPVYRFTLFQDGRYVWEGHKYVSVRGTVRGSMSAAAYARAMQLLRDARYMEFKDRYGAGQECPILATDSPNVEIVVSDAANSKTISHYTGCDGFSRQKDLLQLEDNLDKVFRTRRFTG